MIIEDTQMLANALRNYSILLYFESWVVFIWDLRLFNTEQLVLALRTHNHA